MQQDFLEEFLVGVDVANDDAQNVVALAAHRKAFHDLRPASRGTLERLAKITRPRKIYYHINNTNPILDEESDEHRAVREAGWEIAYDGMVVDL